MTSHTVDDDGTPRVITDLAPLLAEQAEVVARLERVYADYRHLRPDALDGQEPLIVELVNRYNQLADWIDAFRTQAARRANIEAGRELLRRTKGSTS